MCIRSDIALRKSVRRGSVRAISTVNPDTDELEHAVACGELGDHESYTIRVLNYRAGPTYSVQDIPELDSTGTQQPTLVLEC